MPSLIDASLKVGSTYALAAFFGVLLLVVVVMSIRRHGKRGSSGNQSSSLTALAVKLFFGLAALATLTLSVGKADTEGQSNYVGCNSGHVSNIKIESR